MINITISEDRKFQADKSVIGVVGENNVETLRITVPAIYKDYYKYLDFVLPNNGGSYSTAPLFSGQTTFEWTVTNSVLVNGGILKMYVRIDDNGDTIFISDVHNFIVQESAGTTILLPDPITEGFIAPDNSVETNSIADEAVTLDKLGSDVVKDGKIIDGILDGTLIKNLQITLPSTGIFTTELDNILENGIYIIEFSYVKFSITYKYTARLDVISDYNLEEGGKFTTQILTIGSLRQTRTRYWNIIESIYEWRDWKTIPALISETKTAISTGTSGQIAYDNDYFYVCTATNTWKRIAYTPWE